MSRLRMMCFTLRGMLSNRCWKTWLLWSKLPKGKWRVSSISCKWTQPSSSSFHACTLSKRVPSSQSVSVLHSAWFKSVRFVVLEFTRHAWFPVFAGSNSCKSVCHCSFKEDVVCGVPHQPKSVLSKNSDSDKHKAHPVKKSLLLPECWDGSSSLGARTWRLAFWYMQSRGWSSHSSMRKSPWGWAIFCSSVWAPCWYHWAWKSIWPCFSYI